jgi:hypothetical protein
MDAGPLRTASIPEISATALSANDPLDCGAIRTGGLPDLLHDVHGAVIIAMIAVWMMKVAVDEIVDVIAMRHGFVTASRTVYMTGIVTACTVRAGVGVRRTDLYLVLVDVISMRMMQMPVMQVVHVIPMFDRRVPASGAVLVIMMGVMGFIAGCAHEHPPWR